MSQRHRAQKWHNSPFSGLLSMILKKIEWLIKLTGKSGKWKMGRVGGEQRYPCQGSFPCWALAAASTTGTCLGTSHRCCEDWEGIATPPCQPWAVLLSPQEPRTATHRGAQRWVQGTLLPLHAKSRHKQFLKCPRQVLRQAHVLKGLCIFEKSVWPFSQAGKVRICI